MKSKSNYILFRKSDSGFTLVELLVVISIIALLLSILMPSLQKARASAQKVICGNNLKQIGTAIRLYVMEHNDYYPPHRVVYGSTVLPGEGRISALERVAAYLECKEDRRIMSDAWDLNIKREVDYYPVLICPADKNPYLGFNFSSSYGINMAPAKVVFNQGWGLNYLDGRDELLSKQQRSRRSSEIRRPNEFIVASDAWSDYITYVSTPNDRSSMWGMTYRHSKAVDPRKVYPSRNMSNATTPYTYDEQVKIYSGSIVNTLWADDHVESSRFPISPTKYGKVK